MRVRTNKERLDVMSTDISALIAEVDDADTEIEYKTTGGKATGKLIFKDEHHIRIQHVQSEKGAMAAFHHYSESKALVIVYKGAIQIEFTSDRPTEIAKAQEYIELAPFEDHQNTILEDFVAVVVTMPAVETYPDNLAAD